MHRALRLVSNLQTKIGIGVKKAQGRLFFPALSEHLQSFLEFVQLMRKYVEHLVVLITNMDIVSKDLDRFHSKGLKIGDLIVKSMWCILWFGEGYYKNFYQNIYLAHKIVP
ncbi:hypothetical protein SERLA73DRAFT_156307 [Serpula lacrymans var. lacrymans S7.3]|uniref:Uncharacterized protein n=1 Tax=Serpula lacrymans var. lacrymans (strain S7.3) TaxID=936435 RepID=F8QDV9_SERL3|nr:hypothetical protein SERLA73DRAFT_156307 [Serpula lacrymans var. lacrymans S7.3]